MRADRDDPGPDRAAGMLPQGRPERIPRYLQGLDEGLSPPFAANRKGGSRGQTTCYSWIDRRAVTGRIGMLLRPSMHRQTLALSPSMRFVFAGIPHPGSGIFRAGRLPVVLRPAGCRTGRLRRTDLLRRTGRSADFSRRPAGDHQSAVAIVARPDSRTFHDRTEHNPAEDVELNGRG